MITEVEANAVAPAPVSAPTEMVVGLDSFFGPVSTVTVEGQASSLGTHTIESRTAGAQRGEGQLLDDLVKASLARAKRFDQSHRAWSEAGMSCLAAGALSTARFAFGRALKLAPNDRRSLLGMARTCKEAGAIDDAVEVLRGMWAEAPEDPEVVVGLALALGAAGKSAEAKDILERAVPEDVAYAGIFATRGTMRVQDRDFRGAIADLRRAVRLRPDWVHARNVLGIAEACAGNVAAAERRFREAVRVAPSYEPALLNLVRLLTGAERWNEVIDAAERYWTPETASVKLSLFVGNACLAADEVRAARSWLQAAVPKAATSAERGLVLNNLGVAYERLGDSSDAAQAFLASVAAEPKDLPIANYARLLLDDGQHKTAIEWLRGAWENYKVVGPSMQHTLSVALLQLGKYEEAAAVVDELLRSPNPDQNAFALVSGVYVDGLADYTKAERLVRHGLKRWPNEPMLLNNLAYTLLMFGETSRRDEAARLLEALRAMPLSLIELTHVLATEGLLHLWNGDTKAGWRRYEDAAAVAPRASLRERVKAKRDLEMARALMRLGTDPKLVIRLLKRASSAERFGRPYSLHARQELAVVTAASSSEIADSETDVDLGDLI